MTSLLLMQRFPSARLQRLMRAVQAMPAMFCLLLMVLAMWPVWLWSIARMRDGSDEPLGLVALTVLLVALWWRHREWSPTLSLRAALGAAALALCASIGMTGLPMLLRAVFAVLAISCLLAGMASRRQALLPYFGLALLSLPLLSSLQFYAGFPLRVVTAEASLWILRLLGLVVERTGSALMVEGHLILVDAPCSGIHMAWTAYFMACVAAFSVRLPDRVFLLRLPLIGLTVIIGNIVRNTVLVLREAAAWDWPSWMHAGTGLLVLSLVCMVVFGLMSRRVAQESMPRSHEPEARAAYGKAILLLLLFPCALLPLWQQPIHALSSTSIAFVWPERWEGEPLQPLKLTAVEQRFAANFPGAIRRFRAGDRQLVLRQVTAPTRMLHPAGDCYRGLGYAIRDEHLERDIQQRLSRCFVAERAGKRLRVCERISDSRDRSFTDTSSWYWSAVMAQSQGPWLAVTTAEAL
ncbi:MAG: exosortase Q [Moraxellaceae bacterium]